MLIGQWKLGSNIFSTKGVKMGQIRMTNPFKVRSSLLQKYFITTHQLRRMAKIVFEEYPVVVL